jgi:hypothetical protein
MNCIWQLGHLTVLPMIESGPLMLRWHDGQVIITAMRNPLSANRLRKLPGVRYSTRQLMQPVRRVKSTFPGAKKN